MRGTRGVPAACRARARGRRPHVRGAAALPRSPKGAGMRSPCPCCSGRSAGGAVSGTKGGRQACGAMQHVRQKARGGALDAAVAVEVEVTDGVHALDVEVVLVVHREQGREVARQQRAVLLVGPPAVSGKASTTGGGAKAPVSVLTPLLAPLPSTGPDMLTALPTSDGHEAFQAVPPPCRAEPRHARHSQHVSGASGHIRAPRRSLQPRLP